VLLCAQTPTPAATTTKPAAVAFAVAEKVTNVRPKILVRDLHRRCAGDGSSIRQQSDK
jgi:hypothetical protein